MPLLNNLPVTGLEAPVFVAVLGGLLWLLFKRVSKPNLPGILRLAMTGDAGEIQKQMQAVKDVARSLNCEVNQTDSAVLEIKNPNQKLLEEMIKLPIDRQKIDVELMLLEN